MNKQDYINKLWSYKSPAEIVLVMYQLIDNSKWSQVEKDKTYAVLKGIVTYLDRGDDLMEHHRRYLRDEWQLVWMEQKDNSIKEEIKEWLLEPPF
jgi:hypothetical protein